MTAGRSENGECREVIERLYEFLDSELTESSRIKVRRHLDQCGNCLEAFEFETELREVISSKAHDAIPPHLMGRLKEMIENESTHGSS